MSDLWKQVQKLLRLSGQSGPVPPRPADPKSAGFPNTLTSYPEGDGVKRPRLFEPALRHFSRAFRQGDPQFADESTALRWYRARQTVMDGLLRLIGESEWTSHLVLRGSRLMAEWFPEEARAPGDLDWVVVPRSVHLEHPRAAEMLAGIIVQIEAQPLFAEISIPVTEITLDEIWSYERCPGVRLMVPWQAGELPGGTIQMDFVFGERLLIEPVVESVKLCDGLSVRLNAVTRELALLWKVLWLYCDISPQGKDLYDAVLLAETAAFSFPMFKDALDHSDSWWVGRTVSLSEFNKSSLEWEVFVTEYPWIPGTEEYWKSRFAEALQPSFDHSLE